jgi:hypothetical protein
MVVLFAILLLTLPAVAALSQTQAVFAEVEGKVQTRVSGGSWRDAEVGQTVTPGTTISTGFNGSAVIEIGRSVLEVTKLTRMTLEELVRREDTISTDAFLSVGRVKAEVRSTEGLSNDFELRSTQATAAVRGTIFEFDGRRIYVQDGLVSLVNRAGLGTVVGQGEQSRTTATEPPSDPQEETRRDFAVSSSTNPSSEDGEGEDGGARNRLPGSGEEDALVVIDIDW